MEKKVRRSILLEDGTVFHGFGFGSLTEKKFEIVFNTSMAGYQEILSDPSYTDQGVVMSYPLIGNYGMCKEDYEAERPGIAALIAGQYCEKPSNFRSEKTLEEVMREYDIAGVEGIDTRALVRHIRDHGSCRATILSDEHLASEAEALKELAAFSLPTDEVSRASTSKSYLYGENSIKGDLWDKSFGWESSASYRVAAIDCGMKKSILQQMRARGIEVCVVPWNTSADKIAALNPDGIFLSNGPGDPTNVPETIETVKALKGKYPIFGICLGHQILSLAYGARTYKLKFGHRGGNHPVKNLSTGHIEITSQNHSYAVDEKSLLGTPLVPTHINLLDQTIEGVACRKDLAFSVQYHPESAPGPQDSTYLFDLFLNHMKKFREG